MPKTEGAAAFDLSDAPGGVANKKGDGVAVNDDCPNTFLDGPEDVDPNGDGLLGLSDGVEESCCGCDFVCPNIFVDGGFVAGVVVDDAKAPPNGEGHAFCDGVVVCDGCDDDATGPSRFNKEPELVPAPDDVPELFWIFAGLLGVPDWKVGGFWVLVCEG